MKIEQAYNFVNEAQKEILGEQAIDVAKDLSNIVDVGKAIENIYANGEGLDAYVKAIANRIGRMLFVERAYRGSLPKILMDAWEFGSVMGKIQADLLEAKENETWELINGASYDPYVVNLPVVSSKFFNKMATFEIDITLPTEQVKQSFVSADEMARFLSMVETQVNNSMELKIDSLTRTCVINFIGATINNNNGARVVRLLTNYNTIKKTSLTAQQALLDADFLRYACGVLILYKGYLKEYSTLYNIGGKARHTPEDLLHVIVNTEFATRIKTNLGSTTYHKDLVELPKYEEVSSWLGTGTDGAFDSRSKVAGVVALADGTTASVEQSGVVAFMFDHEALGVLQPKRRTTTAYNPKAEYYNEFHKWESRYFNDFQENGVVFLLA